MVGLSAAIVTAILGLMAAVLGVIYTLGTIRQWHKPGLKRNLWGLCAVTSLDTSGLMLWVTLDDTVTLAHPVAIVLVVILVVVGTPLTILIVKSIRLAQREDQEDDDS